MNINTHWLPFQAETRQSLIDFFRKHPNIRLNTEAKKLFEFILTDSFVVCAADTYPVAQYEISGFSTPGADTAYIGCSAYDLTVPEERHNARVKLALLKTVLVAREQEKVPYFLENGTGNCFGLYQYTKRTITLLSVYRSVETIDQQLAVLAPVIQIDAFPMHRAYAGNHLFAMTFTEFATEAKTPYLHV